MKSLKKEQTMQNEHRSEKSSYNNFLSKQNMQTIIEQIEEITGLSNISNDQALEILGVRSFKKKKEFLVVVFSSSV